MYLKKQSTVDSRRSIVKPKLKRSYGGSDSYRLPKISYKREVGWLMPLAAFIVVVMGIMALALTRLVSQASLSHAQERVSLQTFYAAESGAQYAMNQLFYDTAAALVPAAADANCAAVNGNTLTFTATGMNGCQASLACTVSNDPATATSFYQISSDARCQVGNMSAQRVVDVSAFLK